MKIVGEALLFLGIYFVDGKKDWLPGTDQLASQVDVRRCHLGASVHHHDDGVRFFEGNLGLAEDFRGNEVSVFGKNAAGVDDSQAASAPFCFAVKTVSGDARL